MIDHATDNATQDAAEDVAELHQVDAEHDQAHAPAEKPRRGRKPKAPRDAAAREREADAEAIRRELREALSEKDAAKLKAMRERVVTGRGGAKAPAADATPEAAQPAAATNPVDAAAPGWPTRAQVESVRPVAQAVVVALAAVLAPTRYAFHERGEVTVTVAGRRVTTSAADALTDALATVGAKYMPDNAKTPEAYALATVAALFGGPALMHAAETYGPALAQKFGLGGGKSEAPAGSVRLEVVQGG